ncbi:CSLREA domain-containing protein [Chloroflexi bacterium TSY]|nr:CSLREA domain-containing protein [Chloroflexi bacterium TSY]
MTPKSLQSRLKIAKNAKFGSTEPTKGAVFVVNSTADEPDADLGDGICAISSDTNLCTLRAAIEQANALSGLDEISFSLTLPVTIGLDNEIVIADSVTINGPGAEQLTIVNRSEFDDNNTAGARNVFRHFSIRLPNDPRESTVTISQLTLANGKSRNGNSGGSIRFEFNRSPESSTGVSQTLNLDSVVFRNNRVAGGVGGALYARGNRTAVVAVNITDSTFSENQADDDHGGAIYVEQGWLTLAGTTLRGNRAGTDGGALVIDNIADVTISNSVFENNQATKDGGAIANYGGNVTITGSQLRSNQADEDGGAIYNTPLGSVDSALTLRNSSILTGNQAGGFGGAIYNGSGIVTTTVTVADSSIISNSAGNSGGGIYSTATGDSGITGITHNIVNVLEGSQLNRNRTAGSGGAIYVEDGALDVNKGVLLENRVVNQSDTLGGGAIASTRSLVRINDSIFDGNVADFRDGGAISTQTSRVEITASEFISNTALMGGALSCWTNALNLSVMNLSLTDTHFNNNSSTVGGALALNSCMWEASDVRIENNAAVSDGRLDGLGGRGGGIMSFSSIGVITDTILSGNQASDGMGGAIHISNFSFAQVAASESDGGISRLDIVTSTLESNSAGMYGGAILSQASRLTIIGSWLNNNTVSSFPMTETFAFPPSGGGAVFNAGPLNIIDSTISGNDGGTVGGAIANTADEVFVTNSTISGNRADRQGGAVYNLGVLPNISATITIVNSTITRNRSDIGSGIFNTLALDVPDDIAASVEIASTILAGNTGEGRASECVNETRNTGLAPTVVSAGFNLTTIDEGSNCTFDGPGDQILPGDQIFNSVLNPNLADNGGPSVTHALLPGSPAIDHIPLDTNGCGFTIDADQRGVRRPFGLRCDVGAYEAIEAALSISKTVGTEPGVCSTSPEIQVFGGDNLYYCLTVRNSGHFTLTDLVIHDPMLQIIKLPFALTVAPDTTRTLTNVDLPALGSRRAITDMVNTMSVTATTDVLPVTGERLRVTDSATASVIVTPVYTVSLSLEDNVKPVGLRQTVNALVVDHQNMEVSDVTVSFDVTGANPSSGTAITQQNGVASFEYTGIRNILSTDTITANIVSLNNARPGQVRTSLPITAVWRPITVTVSGVGDGTFSEAERTITALVRSDEGELVQGVEVRMVVTATNRPPVTGLSITSEDGTAVFTYTSRSALANRMRLDTAGQGRSNTFNVAFTPAQTRQDQPVEDTDTIVVWVDINRDGNRDTDEPSQTYRVPSVISLARIDALRKPDGSVIIRWQTAVEVDNAGFNLYRSRSPNGPYEKINDRLIGAQGMGIGASYQYVDVPPADGPYYYVLADVDYNGISTRHGPVRTQIVSDPKSTR